MTYGARIFNSGGHTVFSTDDPVFQIIGKGIVTGLGNAGSGTSFIFYDSNNYDEGSYTTDSNGRGSTNAIGDWDDDVLTLFEVNPGERVYRRESFNHSNGQRSMTLATMGGQTSVRWVQVRPATTITPSTGYGMIMYDQNGNPTWDDRLPVLDNVQPLSVTTTNNNFFYWSSDTVYSRDSGIPTLRGIRNFGGSFRKESSSFRLWLNQSNDSRMGGSYDRSTRGFSANIDFLAI